MKKVVEAYTKRRDGCIDMITFLSEHLSEPIENILNKAGIDQEEYNDLEPFNILEIPIPVKKEEEELGEPEVCVSEG